MKINLSFLILLFASIGLNSSSKDENSPLNIAQVLGYYMKREVNKI